MTNLNRFYTYAYLREDRTPYYIGKGTRDRIFANNRVTKKPKDKSKIIFLKQNLTEDEAFKHEIYMIDVFGRKDLGTGILHNRTNGGEGSSGFTHSEETKNKMSQTRKGKVPSEETRNKIGERQKGKVIPEYQKNKISQSHKGKKHSEETKKKMSEMRKGRTLSDEHKKKLSESRKGIQYSEETKKKMSEARKGKTPWNKGKSMPKI